MLQRFIRYLNRKRSSVEFNDLIRTEPVSRVFGQERGTPVDRYFIERFLSKNTRIIKGRILEVGDSHYSKMYAGEQAESIDVFHADPGNKSASVIGDLTKPDSLPKEHYDCFICTQTFNFIFDVQSAILGAHYLLKPGGVMIATVAGISQISRYDMDRWGDYWRFTTASLQNLFEPVFKGGIEIVSYGNVMASCAFLQGVAVEDLPDRTLLDLTDPDYQMLIAIIARKES